MGEGYEIRRKIIVNTSIAHVYNQHYIHSIMPEMNGLKGKTQWRIKFDTSIIDDKYDMFILHASDHWRNLEKSEVYMNFNSTNDVKMFFDITQAKCDFQNIILWWNQQFLKSQYGNKWIGKLGADPLLAKDGRFCYYLRNNTNLKWTQAGY